MGKRHPVVLILAGFGYAILYIPILIMIIYSFNSLRLRDLKGLEENYC